MTEVWKPIPSLPGFEASNHGRVRRGKKIRRASLDRDGYLKFMVRAEDRYRNVYVHQLVLEAFVGPRPEGMVSRHLDGDRQNNRAENLAYGTQAENMADRAAHGNNPKGQRNGRSKLTPALVRLVRLARKGGASFGAIASAVNMNAKTIEDICKRRLWKDVA